MPSFCSCRSIGRERPSRAHAGGESMATMSGCTSSTSARRPDRWMFLGWRANSPVSFSTTASSPCESDTSTPRARRLTAARTGSRHLPRIEF
jgi:hypothetical protein